VSASPAACAGRGGPDTAKTQPDKDEIAARWSVRLRNAGKAAGFAETAGKIAPHVQNAVGWPGENWRELLPLVGFAA
jgi:hypothetical protein